MAKQDSRVKIEVRGQDKIFFPGVKGRHKAKTKLIHKPKSQGEYAKEESKSQY